MSAFPDRWPPQHPDRLQLYSLATPNGRKVSIALEELGIPYEAHRIDIGAGDQHDPGFRAINPNGRIPAIIDPDGPEGEPVRIFESGAILVYLAEKTGQLLGGSATGRLEVLQWLLWQVGGVGPMFGQYGHFVRVARGKTDMWGENRYRAETQRLLGVLDGRLAEVPYLAGEYSIADIATGPWVEGLAFYGVEEDVGLASFAHVAAWMARLTARPAWQRGRSVCA